MPNASWMLLALFALAAPATAADEPVAEFFDSGTVVPSGLPFSEAVRVGPVLYLSGQIGNVPGTMKLVEGGLGAESGQAMRNIEAVLKAHGYALDDLVKCTVMLADMSRWSEFNEVYKGFFDGRYPARSAMGVSGLALGAQVEIECIAAGPGAR